jgi:formylglycine-generating enzyme required for sulfatase activity/serine/threonine protein kinase
VPSSRTEFLGYLPQGTQLFEYVIERVLGHGGFGITYLAQDTLLDKPVAIKEYLPTDLAMRAGLPQVVLRAPDMREAFIWGREQFLKEARTLARFSHPNLITVHRFFEAHDTAYFVMEYAQGQTLAQILKREQTLPFDRLRDVLLPILNGLAQVHRGGVLHRDIKPDNIMLRADGTPVLIDFGAARLTLGSKTRSILSVLTAGYAPLEQYGSAGSNQGPWTDIYALGAVTYRAITGKKPADAVNRVHADPQVPASVAGQGKYPVEFLEAIDWSLSVIPEHRPRTVEEWRDALEGKTRVPDEARAAIAAATAHLPAADDDGVEKSSWERLAESAAREFAEFSGEIPASHADTPSAPQRLSSITRSLSMVPDAAPAQRTTWIAAAVMLALVLGLFEYVIHSNMTAPPPPQPGAAPEVAPAIPEAPLGQKLDTTLTGLPPPDAVIEAPAPPPTSAMPATEAKLVPETKPAATPTDLATPAAPPKAKAPKAAKGEPAIEPLKKSAPAGAVSKLAAGAQFSDCDQCPPMVVLAPAAFTMGAPLEPSTNSWERPAHQVKLKRPFAIATHEVTVAQWKACASRGACVAQNAGRDAGALPVTDVSWDEVQAYIAWLSKTTGRKYRLPSEAEWEFAERGGTTASRFWGDDRGEQCAYANGADQSARDVVDKGLRVALCDDHFARLAPVGSFTANAFGLFDMLGNAWEWTQDCWHDTFVDAPVDGSAIDAKECPTRVIRGGSWRAKPESLRSYSRGLSTPDHRGDDLGFRVVAD